MGRRVSLIEGKKYDPPDPSPLPNKVALVAEVAERLLELAELDLNLPAKLLAKFDQLWRRNPRTFWVCLEVLAGDRANELSLSQIASRFGTDKQNVAQTRRRDFEEIKEKFPEVAECLKQLFGRVPNAKTKPTNAK